MTDPTIKAAEERLDETFFQGDAKDLRGAFDREQLVAVRLLEEAGRLSDPGLVDRLLGLGIRAETLAALALVPLVEVAWADGRMHQRERDAVLAAVESSGIPPESASYRLLRIWTQERPQPDLEQAWSEFIRATLEQLDGHERTSFRTNVMGRARAVAEAAGGLLGLTSKVSRSENEVLDRLRSVFGD